MKLVWIPLNIFAVDVGNISHCLYYSLPNFWFTTCVISVQILGQSSFFSTHNKDILTITVIPKFSQYGPTFVWKMWRFNLFRITVEEAFRDTSQPHKWQSMQSQITAGVNKPSAVAGTRQSESILSNGRHKAYSAVQRQNSVLQRA